MALKEFRRGTAEPSFSLIQYGSLGKCSANHATFPVYENIAFSTAYDLRTKSAKSTGSERNGPRRANFGLFRAWPVNRFTPKTPGILPKSGRIGWGESECRVGNGVGKGTGKVNVSDCLRTAFRATKTFKVYPVLILGLIALAFGVTGIAERFFGWYPCRLDGKTQVRLYSLLNFEESKILRHLNRQLGLIGAGRGHMHGSRVADVSDD
jgi:hypothetical protein